MATTFYHEAKALADQRVGRKVSRPTNHQARQYLSPQERAALADAGVKLPQREARMERIAGRLPDVPQVPVPPPDETLAGAGLPWQRVGEVTAKQLGPELGGLVASVLVAMVRRQIPQAIGRIVLERILPNGRPVQLDLPTRVTSAAKLMEAEDKIGSALNAGTISPSEARQLQAWAKSAYRSGRIAANA